MQVKTPPLSGVKPNIAVGSVAFQGLQCPQCLSFIFIMVEVRELPPLVSADSRMKLGQVLSHEEKCLNCNFYKREGKSWDAIGNPSPTNSQSQEELKKHEQ